jgi:hypothetical protein
MLVEQLRNMVHQHQLRLYIMVPQVKADIRHEVPTASVKGLPVLVFDGRFHHLDKILENGQIKVKPHFDPLFCHLAVNDLLAPGLLQLVEYDCKVGLPLLTEVGFLVSHLEVEVVVERVVKDCGGAGQLQGQ